MGIDPVSLGIGIVSGFASSFFANLTSDRVKRWRLRRKIGASAYVTVADSSGSFEGYVDVTSGCRLIYSRDNLVVVAGRTLVSVEEILRNLQKASSSEPKKDASSV